MRPQVKKSFPVSTFLHFFSPLRTNCLFESVQSNPSLALVPAVDRHVSPGPVGIGQHRISAGMEIRVDPRDLIGSLRAMVVSVIVKLVCGGMAERFFDARLVAFSLQRKGIGPYILALFVLR